jgi:hypothetical protein
MTVMTVMTVMNYSIFFAIIIAIAYAIWWKFFKTEKFSILDDYNRVNDYGPLINATQASGVVNNLDPNLSGYADLS